MRLIFLPVCFIFLFSCSDSKKTSEAKEERKLYWSEEFNYTGLPDSTIWNYDVGGHGWGNNELQYYTQASISNVEVSDGTLKLKALREKTGDKNYSSARLITKGKVDFTYGRIEIRAKLPSGRGLWPAIWMMGKNIDTVDWPRCGEIDIMEHVGFEQDSIFGTIHSQSYNHLIGTQKTRKAFIEDPYGSFHVFAIEWTADRMDFFLDDKLFNQVINEHKTKSEWPFDDPFYMILNIAVGGNLGGQKGVDEQVFPATLEVDYIRAYTL